MKKAKERIIFDNYNIEKYWKETAIENLVVNGIDRPSEEKVWDEMSYLSAEWWCDTVFDLTCFFDGAIWIMVGTVGRWNGNFAAGTVFDSFAEMFKETIKDCDYWKIWDENGHLFFQCSHHDGTNCYEIKRVTQKGEIYLENWENNWNDKRSEKYIHKKIMEKYSILPRYAETVFGSPKREYEEDERKVS